MNEHIDKTKYSVKAERLSIPFGMVIAAVVFLQMSWAAAILVGILVTLGMQFGFLKTRIVLPKRVETENSKGQKEKNNSETNKGEVFTALVTPKPGFTDFLLNFGGDKMAGSFAILYAAGALVILVINSLIPIRLVTSITAIAVGIVLVAVTYYGYRLFMRKNWGHLYPKEEHVAPDTSDHKPKALTYVLAILAVILAVVFLLNWGNIGQVMATSSRNGFGNSIAGNMDDATKEAVTVEGAVATEETPPLEEENPPQIVIGDTDTPAGAKLDLQSGIDPNVIAENQEEFSRHQETLATNAKAEIIKFVQGSNYVFEHILNEAQDAEERSKEGDNTVIVDYRKILQGRDETGFTPYKDTAETWRDTFVEKVNIVAEQEYEGTPYMSATLAEQLSGAVRDGVGCLGFLYGMTWNMQLPRGVKSEDVTKAFEDGGTWDEEYPNWKQAQSQAFFYEACANKWNETYGDNLGIRLANFPHTSEEFVASQQKNFRPKEEVKEIPTTPAPTPKPHITEEVPNDPTESMEEEEELELLPCDRDDPMYNDTISGGWTSLNMVATPIRWVEKCPNGKYRVQRSLDNTWYLIDTIPETVPQHMLFRVEYNNECYGKGDLSCYSVHEVDQEGTTLELLHGVETVDEETFVNTCDTTGDDPYYKGQYVDTWQGLLYESTPGKVTLTCEQGGYKVVLTNGTWYHVGTVPDIPQDAYWRVFWICNPGDEVQDACYSAQVVDPETGLAEARVVKTLEPMPSAQEVIVVAPTPAPASAVKPKTTPQESQEPEMSLVPDPCDKSNSYNSQISGTWTALNMYGGYLFAETICEDGTYKVVREDATWYSMANIPPGIGLGTHFKVSYDIEECENGDTGSLSCYVVTTR